MVRALLVAVVLLGSATAQAQQDQRSRDEQGILRLQKEFSDAWNRSDTRAMAATFTTDADYISPAGGLAQGRSEIQRVFDEEQRATFSGSRFSARCGEVRFLDPEVAQLDCDFTVTGITRPQGAPSTMRGIYTVTLVRRGTDWRVASARAMVPTPAMGESARPLGPPPGASPRPMR